MTELCLCVLEVHSVQLLAIGIVRISAWDWTQHSQLTAHTAAKIISDTEVIFSPGTGFYLLFLPRNRWTGKRAGPRDSRF